MPIPFNRIVAFAGPYISLTAGVIATWLIAKLNALGIAGLDQSDLAQQLGGALTFTLVAVLSWMGQSQWLKGHQLQLVGDANVQAAAVAAAAPTAVEVPPDPEHDALMSWGEDLPDDDEEFAMPPDEDARITPEVPA
jgi:hypothetical protein